MLFPVPTQRWHSYIAFIGSTLKFLSSFIMVFNVLLTRSVNLNCAAILKYYKPDAKLFNTKLKIEQLHSVYID